MKESKIEHLNDQINLCSFYPIPHNSEYEKGLCKIGIEVGNARCTKEDEINCYWIIRNSEEETTD